MRFTHGSETLEIEIGACVVAGWTGADPDKIAHHIEELAAIGVPRPSTVPLYYRVAAGLLTQAETIQVVGPGSSGEVEPLVVAHRGTLYLGLASDHTDRDLEAHSVALSKQACAKPVAPALWSFEEVADRLARLRLRSWIEEEGAWTPYQDGTLSAIRPLAELVEGAGLLDLAGADGSAVMLGGTFPVLSGGIRPATRFRMRLDDPDTDRAIEHGYAVTALPIVA